jgi:2-polyprenyl-3-methyl-5-hydroxy-6-metoxy-1,4-benzoquinol methylase
LTETLNHADGWARIAELGAGRRRITAGLTLGDGSVSESSWDTKYPVHLIESVFEVKGPGWVCDEIRRDEDPAYVNHNLNLALFGFLDESTFAGKRLLDFGCGCGSSSLNLARMVSDLEIVGVELLPEFVALARERADFHGASNVSFHQSPGGQSLPEGLGDFDFIVLSAVYEHLLPAERPVLLPMLWSHLNPGGVLFINQLPHRNSPVENHTTGLPGLNYLPASWAHQVALRSKRTEPGESWESMLRRGIRGGTANEIVDILKSEDGAPHLLEPNRIGLNDRIDLWFALSMGSRLTGLKRAIKAALKGLKGITGITFVPELSLAIQKTSRSPHP